MLKSTTKVIKRRVPVTAVSIDDVENILRKLGVYDMVENGEATCYICGRKITTENIGGILMVCDRIVLICDKPSCIGRATLLSKRIEK